ncbi:MAG: 4'-phosphopantetheinyl transferase superfamily protein [Xanthomonadales bacterium]|nr:4'-phosphopantetheinyl transferase superfamily protein [Xanthomonadales bacterium]
MPDELKPAGAPGRGVEARASWSPYGWPPALQCDEIHLCHLVLPAGMAPRDVGAAAHALLGRLIGHYAGGVSPPRLARGPHGKPHAPDFPGFEFNLSHAGCHVSFAFARDQPLGVDIEWRERRIQVQELARRFFTAAEADALDGLAPDLRRAAFLRLWTHKEAVLKAFGVGLSFGLDRLEFSLDARGAVAALRAIDAACGPVHEWRLHAFRPAPGVEGALAWRGPPRRVRMFALAFPAPGNAGLASG